MPRIGKAIDKMRRDVLDPVRLELLEVIREYAAPVNAVSVRPDATGFDIFMDNGKNYKDMPKGTVPKMEAIVRRVGKEQKAKYTIGYREKTSTGAEFIRTGWSRRP